MQKSTEVFIPSILRKKNTRLYMRKFSYIYTCNKREKFEVVIRNKHRYAMNGNVDISLNQ